MLPVRPYIAGARRDDVPDRGTTHVRDVAQAAIGHCHDRAGTHHEDHGHQGAGDTAPP